MSNKVMQHDAYPVTFSCIAQKMDLSETRFYRTEILELPIVFTVEKKNGSRLKQTLNFDGSPIRNLWICLNFFK